MSKSGENIKKILCCSSLVKDLVVVAMDESPGQLPGVVLSDEAIKFIEAATVLTAKLEEIV